MTLRCMPARSPKLRQISILMPRPWHGAAPEHGWTSHQGHPSMDGARRSEYNRPWIKEARSRRAAKAGMTRARPPRSDTAPLREGRMSPIRPKRYDAFLSYNSQDGRPVKEVAE